VVDVAVVLRLVLQNQQRQLAAAEEVFLVEQLVEHGVGVLGVLEDRSHRRVREMGRLAHERLALALLRLDARGLLGLALARRGRAAGGLDDAVLHLLAELALGLRHPDALGVLLVAELLARGGVGGVVFERLRERGGRLGGHAVLLAEKRQVAPLPRKIAAGGIEPVDVLLADALGVLALLLVPELLLGVRIALPAVVALLVAELLP